MLGFWPSSRISRQGSGPATSTCSPDAAASCFPYSSAWSNSECSCRATRDASTWYTVKAAVRRWSPMCSALKATTCSLVKQRRGCGPNKNAEPGHKPRAAYTTHCLNAPMVGAWIGFAAGLMLVLGTLMSVAGTLVVPRAVNSPASRTVDWLLDIVFRILTKPVRSFERRDKILSWQAPMSLLTRLAAWLGMLIVGFSLLLLPSMKGHLGQAFSEAGSSIFTLGYAAPSTGDSTTLEYLAAFTGLVVIGLQVGYLPTLYAAFNRRETEVTLLTSRAGVPAWGPEILARIRWGIEDGDIPLLLEELFTTWERWAAEVAESHTTYLTLARMRSPRPLSHWLTSLIAVMDAAAMHLALAPSREPKLAARLSLRMGFVAMEQIATFMRLPVPDDPDPDGP